MFYIQYLNWTSDIQYLNRMSIYLNWMSIYLNWMSIYLNQMLIFKLEVQYPNRIPISKLDVQYLNQMSIYLNWIPISKLDSDIRVWNTCLFESVELSLKNDFCPIWHLIIMHRVITTPHSCLWQSYCFPSACNHK